MVSTRQQAGASGGAQRCYMEIGITQAIIRQTVQCESALGRVAQEAVESFSVRPIWPLKSLSCSIYVSRVITRDYDVVPCGNLKKAVFTL
jgi:hypothetical protein